MFVKVNSKFEVNYHNNHHLIQEVECCNQVLKISLFASCRINSIFGHCPSFIYFYLFRKFFSGIPFIIQ